MPYGDSFGGLEQASLAEAAQRHAAFENSIGRLTGAIGELRRRQQINRQMALQEQSHLDMLRQQAVENQFRQSQADIGNAGTPFQRQTHGDLLAQQAADLALRTKQQKFAEDNAATSNALAWDAADRERRREQAMEDAGTPQANRRAEFMLSYGDKLAQQGAISSPDHAAKLAGGDPDIAQALYSTSQQVRQGHENAYVVANHGADTLNQYNAAKAELADLQKNQHWYNAENPRVKLLNDKITALQPRARLLEGNPAFDKMVTVDPSTGRYVPAVPRPPWWTGPQAPDASGPTIGNPAGRSLDNSLPSAPTSSAASQLNNGPAAAWSGMGVVPRSTGRSLDDALPASGNDGWTWPVTSPTDAPMPHPAPTMGTLNNSPYPVGKKVIQNGATYSWDGQQFVPVVQ